MGIIFVDVETTGLDPRIHRPWEIALVLPDAEPAVFQVAWPDWVLRCSDSVALKVGGFNSRFGREELVSPLEAKQMVQGLTAGRHLVGINPAFDAGMLATLFDSPQEVPWHYRVMDVRPLALGCIVGQRELDIPEPPWSMEVIAAALDVEPASEEERHTALGDALWARRIWEAVMT